MLRFAGVHSLVINVMKSYFSFSETLSNAFPSSFGTESNGFVGMTQTLKLAVSDVSIINNFILKYIIKLRPRHTLISAIIIIILL